MELFREPLEYIKHYLTGADQRKVLKRSNCSLMSSWPRETSLVMQADTGLELGGAEGSLFMILWTEQDGVISPGQVSLVGPDINETKNIKLPFAQVIMVYGDFQDEYETYQLLLDTLLGAKLKDVSIRFWPDRQRIWYRVSGQALKSGFNLMRCGCTLLDQFQSLPAVKGAEIIISAESLTYQPFLQKAAASSSGILEALVKIHEDLNFNCEDCDYREVCDEVGALKDIHRRLQEEKSGL